MIRIKPGVHLTGIRPELVLAVVGTVLPIFAQKGLDAVITSCTEGTHSAQSLHYSGSAVDVRLRPDAVPILVIKAIIDEIKAALGTDFDCIFEENPPHMHLEYQPRWA